MNKIYIDFETYSPVSIDDGTVKYTKHPDADIVLFSYKIDNNPTKLVNGGQLPNELVNAVSNPYMDFRLYAHNALFDYLVWHNIGAQYGYPVVSLGKWVDTMALANRYSLPGGLAEAGAVMGVPVQKSRRGTALIKKICVPTPYGTRPKLNHDFTLNDLREFGDYCKQDIDSTTALVSALPADTLADREQLFWQITQYMNLSGLPIDDEASKTILSYLLDYVSELSLQVPILTRGQVNKVTEVKKLKTFIVSQGVNIPDLAAATVERYLAKDDLPEVVHELLELRQMLGRSSTAKYVKMQSMLHEGRVHNNLQYWGTHTGRWSGRGLQMHNLPRASVKDPEVIIQSFLDFKPVEDAVTVAKALIRSMICAPPGYMIIVSDYLSIENRILAWLASDEDAVQLFRQGGDQYIDMATFLYAVPRDQVTKAQRQMGKIIILGCGYGMGAKTFLETAKSWNVELSIQEAMVAVDAYRAKYPKIKKMWYALMELARKAVRNPGYKFEGYRCKFWCTPDRNKRMWLIITLPSGRNLMYMEPSLEADTYGDVIKHWGVNPYSKKWSRMTMIPGRITENIVQAIARDVMANGLLTVYSKMPEVELILTVHDEGGGLIHESDIYDNTQELFNQYLCSEEPWHDGLPLAAEGYISKRYKKG